MLKSSIACSHLADSFSQKNLDSFLHPSTLLRPDEMPGTRFRSRSLGSFSCSEEARLIALLTRGEGKRKRQVALTLEEPLKCLYCARIYSILQEEKIRQREADIAGLEERRHKRIASHLGNNFVVECYMGVEQAGKSLLALSETLGNMSNLNDQLLAKEEMLVKLETNLCFELQGLSFDSNTVFETHKKADLFLSRHKLLHHLENELKLSSIRFASLLQRLQQLEVEKTKGENSVINRMLHPQLERDLRQSSLELARLVQTQQGIEKPSDGVVNSQQEHGFQLEQSDCLEVEEMDKMVIKVESMRESDSGFLQEEEEEISQSSLQLTLLMENNTSTEEDSEGSGVSLPRQAMKTSGVTLTSSRGQAADQPGLMMTGKDTWSDDRECGSTSASPPCQVSLITHSQ